MPTKWLSAPLVILFIVTLGSVAGLASTAFNGNASIGTQLITSNNVTYFYDSHGNPIVYAANLTGVEGAGHVQELAGFNGGTAAAWTNATGTYLMYFDTSAKQLVYYDQMNGAYSNSQTDGNVGVAITMDSILGLIAFAGALMAIGAVIGLHFLSSGEADVSVGMVLKFTGFLGLWTILSALSYPLIGKIPLSLGTYMYFGLTLSFIVGLVDSIGHPSGR